MSTSLNRCANIDQFHQAHGYATLYSKLSSRSRDDHEDKDFESEWVTAARRLCERDPDREWIEKWSSNALSYSQSNCRATSTPRAPSGGSDLFIDTSWHLLRNDEREAIKLHNIYRSKLNLSSLPNGFRFIDIVVEVINTPADVQPVDHHAPQRQTESQSETQVIGIKYLDRTRSVSPLTDLEDHEGQPSFLRPRKKTKGRHSQLDNHQSTTESNKLRRRRSERLASASLAVPQHQPSHKTFAADLRRSIMDSTNISWGTHFEEAMSSEQEPLINTLKDADRASRKAKKTAALANLSILPEAGIVSTLALPDTLAEDYGAHSARVSPSQENLKRKVTSGAYNPDLECEPPRKRLGRDMASNADSGSCSGKSSQQQIAPISNSLWIPEPAALPSSQMEYEINTDTTVQQPENTRKKRKGKGKGKDANVRFHNLYTPMIAERRPPRSAAHKAQGKIHEQYLIDPNDPMKDVHQISRKVDNKSRSKEMIINRPNPVNTVPEPSNSVTELPSKENGRGRGKGRKGRRGKKKGKNRSNSKVKNQAVVNLTDNEDGKITLPTIIVESNRNASQTKWVSVASISHSTACVSSSTVVAGSSSNTACSYPLTTSANGTEKRPAWTKLHFIRLGPSRKKQIEKPTVGLPEPEPSITHTQCQNDDQAGLHDNSNPAYVQPVQQPVQPVQVQCPPWSMPHDGTNYSNGIRIPGSNDTHSWQVSKTRTVEFPPLQGESLCPDIRLHKPELPNQPPVWSVSRQELCESLSYFRAYQGGVYTHKQRAEGYLLDGYPARYDIWHSDGRYIISHGGGHSAVDKLTGRASLIEDQASDSASCAALISTWKAGQPIAVIAGGGYRLFPFSLGERNYVVLGYYHIIHAWEEPEPSTINSRGYCVRWKFLFRWIEAQGSPWWLNETEGPKPLNTPLPSQICASCNESSCHIFSYGWVCTHSDCSAFFELSDKSNITHEGYNLDFLAPREDPVGLKSITLDVRPQPPVRPIILPDNTEKAQLATSRHFWKGFWCEKCGKLSCREFWTYWKCSYCMHMFVIKATIQVPPSLGSVKMKILFDRSAGIEEKLVILGDTSDPYRCHTFVLPFNRGKIHVIKASQQSLQIANRIFQQYQLDASNDEMFFRRYSMKTHKSGEPYAYVGGTNNTVELDKYRSVTKALDYIRTRATLALGWNPEFNEVLSAAYMEEQKMEYHSDGEKDLGPIVASLSLGSPAIMKFRPVPSKWMSSDGQMKEGRKTPPVIIELTLRHGDALVMEGAEIQEYYQHAVHPCGFRIAATARRVNIT